MNAHEMHAAIKKALSCLEGEHAALALIRSRCNVTGEELIERAIKLLREPIDAIEKAGGGK